MERAQDVIDFRELVSSVPGEGLELLVRQIGQRQNLSPSSTGRGADAGRDLFFTERLSGPISKQKIKWLVSCKDKATSNESVKESDLPAGGIREKLEQHKADGFLLVTTTVPSSATKEKLDKLDKSAGGTIYTCLWDKSDLTTILLQPQNHDLLKQFLPESYKRVRGSGADVEIPTSESLLERATMSPRQTMLDEWQYLEQSISEAGARNESVIQNAEPLNPSATVNALFAARKITEEVREEFFQLKKWHQAVALPGQQYHPEPREAVGFAERTSTLKLKFESI